MARLCESFGDRDINRSDPCAAGVVAVAMGANTLITGRAVVISARMIVRDGLVGGNGFRCACGRIRHRRKDKDREDKRHRCAKPCQSRQ